MRFACFSAAGIFSTIPFSLFVFGSMSFIKRNNDRIKTAIAQVYWILIAIAVLTLVPISMLGVALRYEVELAGLLIICAAIGAGSLYSLIKEEFWRKLLLGCMLAFVLYGAIIHVGISMSGEADYLKCMNPNLYDGISSTINKLTLH